jgi:hypothetical protein
MTGQTIDRVRVRRNHAGTSHRHIPMDMLTTQDRDHLKLLAIFHYIFAALGVCGLGFVGLHYTMMTSVMSMEGAKNRADAPPEAFMDIMIWFYVAMAAMFFIGTALNVLAARYLQARKHRTFCMVVAGLNVLQVPLGTLLGVFTLLVLARDSVRQAFEPIPTVSSS